MYNRHQVYKACLAATVNGVDCMAFGNACGATNKGQYKRPFYQNIAAKYFSGVQNVPMDKLWKRYHAAKYPD